nr:monovalent cation/H(+) antiporter subunit G [Haloglomus sp. DT116]
MAALALAAGAVGFTAIAVVGLFRLPDCYSRAHATSKSDTLGALLAVLAAAVAFAEPTTTLKLGALFLFLLLTGPTAAHAIVRSADDQGVEPWARAVADGPGGDPDDGAAPTPTDGGEEPRSEPRRGGERADGGERP